MYQDDIIFVFCGINFTWEGIGIAIAAIFSILSCAGNVIVFFREKKKISIQHITQKKIDWISVICEESARYASIVLDLCMKSVITDEDLKELIKEEYTLRMYLSRDSAQNRQASHILEYLKKIRNTLHEGDYESVNRLCESFVEEICIYLNAEWENVKEEVTKF